MVITSAATRSLESAYASQNGKALCVKLSAQKANSVRTATKTAIARITVLATRKAASATARGVGKATIALPRAKRDGSVSDAGRSVRKC